MKKLLFIFILLLVSHSIFAGSISFSSLDSNGARSGIGIGTIIAILCSWERNKSILWALLHALCGWLYVIYYVITR